MRLAREEKSWPTPAVEARDKQVTASKVHQAVIAATSGYTLGCFFSLLSFINCVSVSLQIFLGLARGGGYAGACSVLYVCQRGVCVRLRARFHIWLESDCMHTLLTSVFAKVKTLGTISRTRSTRILQSAMWLPRADYDRQPLQNISSLSPRGRLVRFHLTTENKTPPLTVLCPLPHHLPQLTARRQAQHETTRCRPATTSEHLSRDPTGVASGGMRKSGTIITSTVASRLRRSSSVLHTDVGGASGTSHSTQHPPFCALGEGGKGKLRLTSVCVR